jgi:hypothetical protein
MLVAVTCPKCQKQSNVPDSNLGRRIRCAGCQAIYQAVDDTAPPAPAAPLLPQRRAAPPPLPQPYNPSEDSNDLMDAAPALQPVSPVAARFGHRVGIVLIALLMVACGLLAAVYLNKR